MAKLITKMSLADEAREKLDTGKMRRVETVKMSTPILSGTFTNMSSQQRFDAIAGMNASAKFPSRLESTMKFSGKYNSGFDVPLMWEGSEKKESITSRIESGKFNPMMSGSNTLPTDWQNLWDALRIDVTVKKAALPTVRQFFYRITKNANFTRTLKPTEMGRASIYFEENNGHGQAVPQGEIIGGGYETFDITVYAAGFTWDLLGELFGMAITPDELTNAIAMGENALKDDIAISPILNFSYATEALTAPSTIGTGSQELLYNTLINARNDMRVRVHPATGRKLDTSNVVVLASAYDAENIMDVSKGLPSVQDKTLNAISQIKQVIAYEGETIELRDRTIEYEGVTEGTAFMLIPYTNIQKSGYMEIAVKEDLVIETDLVPDVNTLARKQQAYRFTEGIWYKGIEYFVQKITLPAWSF